MNTSNRTVWQVAEIELHYRTMVDLKDSPLITCSRDAYEILLETWNEGRLELCEELRLILLNIKGRVLGIVDLSVGTTGFAPADPRLIFASAIKANASSIILSHNHPSGEVTPSMEDKGLTERISQLGALHQIKLFDHIIVARNGYYSFADDGLL